MTRQDIYKNCENDLSFYQKMFYTFFNPKNRIYDSTDYLIFSDGADRNCAVSGNSFYANRKTFNRNYRNGFDSSDFINKFSLSAPLFYQRLHLYLFDTSEPSSTLQVTNEFFPHYIALISSDSKKTNWITLKENIIKLSQSLLITPNTKYENTLTDSERIPLITYWLNLTFPDKLYELAHAMENLLQKEIRYDTYRYLKHNLSLHLSDIAGNYFKTLTLQDLFLDDAIKQFHTFTTDRKKGTSIAAIDELKFNFLPYNNLKHELEKHIH